MKKDRSSPGSSKQDNSLPRSKILRGRKNFQRLFEKSTVLNTNSFQFRFRIYPDPDEGCLIGFGAPKKRIVKAVHRNRAKRLLREAYRLNQEQLNELFSKKRFGFHGLFMANSDNLTYADVETDMISALEQTRSCLEGYTMDRQESDRNLKTGKSD